jgi:hypothetical protein
LGRFAGSFVLEKSGDITKQKFFEISAKKTD